jgi:hypothetical protein
MSLYLFALIALVALGLVIGQICWKLGRDRQQELSLRVVSDPWIIAGLVVFGLSTIVWWYVLPRVQLSVAYPINSLAYVFAMVGRTDFPREHHGDQGDRDDVHHDRRVRDVPGLTTHHGGRCTRLPTA